MIVQHVSPVISVLQAHQHRHNAQLGLTAQKVQVKSSIVQQVINVHKVPAHRKNAMLELIVQASSHLAPNAQQDTIVFPVLHRQLYVRLVVTATFKLKYVSCVLRAINVLMAQSHRQFVLLAAILGSDKQTVMPVLRVISVFKAL